MHIENTMLLILYGSSESVTHVRSETYILSDYKAFIYIKSSIKFRLFSNHLLSCQDVLTQSIIYTLLYKMGQDFLDIQLLSYE